MTSFITNGDILFVCLTKVVYECIIKEAYTPQKYVICGRHCRISLINDNERKSDMKNKTKRIIAATALLCVAMTSIAGCSAGTKTSSSSSSEITSTGPTEAPILQVPFEFGAADENVLAQAAADPDVDVEAADPTKPAEGATDAKEDTTKIQEVTDAKGEPVTQVVEATNAKGEKATDAAGQPATEIVKVTQVVSGGSSSKPDTKPESTYTAKRDGRYAMWLDISKDEDFFFNGDFIEVTFKVKDDAPDGDYPISLTTDLSNIKAVSLKPDALVDGVIRVNNGTIEAADVSDQSGLVFYGDKTAAKQGDEITYHINIANNPGLAAFCVWFYYDGNALEVVDCAPSGEFEKIASDAEFGGEGAVK